MRRVTNWARGTSADGRMPFEVMAARFGVVGDFEQVMPAFIEAVKKVKAEG